MNKGKIPVVDDEPAVRLLLHNVLSEEYTVVEASDGKQAIALAAIEPPDLILMDIMMPRMDGYVACGRIKKDPLLKDIPVVMLTTVGYELNKKLAQEVGAEGYITKPFDLQELMAIINRLMKK